MARGYWRVQRYQVFFGQASLYASTEKQAVKLAKKNGGTAIECDGGRQVYPPPNIACSGQAATPAEDEQVKRNTPPATNA